MDKAKLKQALIEEEKHIIDEVTMDYEDFLSNSKLNQADIVDADDLSHLRTTGEISDRLDGQIHEHQDHLDTINNTSFEPTDIVKPGAVVSINGRCLVVAVAQSKFEFDGREYIGISTQAPIYAQLAGKKMGDEFMFNNRNFTIESVD